MTLYKMQNLVYEWVDFSKFGQILSQNWLKFKKILEKIGNFVQNLAQNWAGWYMNGLLFLEKLVFVWVYFQIPWRHIPTKTKLEYPPRVWNILKSWIARIKHYMMNASIIIPWTWCMRGTCSISFRKLTSNSIWLTPSLSIAWLC